MSTTAHEICSASRNAQLTCPVVDAIDQLYAVSPIPPELLWVADLGAEVSDALRAGGDILAALAAIEVRRGELGQLARDQLAAQRDREADQLLRAGAGELEETVTAALRAAEDAQRLAEIEMVKYGVSPPWGESADDFGNVGVYVEPVGKLQQQAVAAGSSALAAWERWRDAWERRRKLIGLATRLRRLDLIGATSPALESGARWPRTAPKPTAGQRVKAALTGRKTSAA